MKQSSGALLLLLTAVIGFYSFRFYEPRQTQSDTNFAMLAVQSNIAEIHAGKLAIAKSTDQAVKGFAQKMVSDHTAALSELDSIIKASKIKGKPKQTDQAHQQLAQRLKDLDGAAFDSAYISGQLEDHQQAVALFEQEVTNGTDAALRAYAIKTLPTLKLHLEQAQSLSSKKAQ